MIIYSKDVEKITGKSGRSARKIMSDIRRKFGKSKYQLISVGEFCTYMSLPEAEVHDYLGNTTV